MVCHIQIQCKRKFMDRLGELLFEVCVTFETSYPKYSNISDVFMKQLGIRYLTRKIINPSIQTPKLTTKIKRWIGLGETSVFLVQ